LFFLFLSKSLAETTAPHIENNLKPKDEKDRFVVNALYDKNDGKHYFVVRFIIDNKAFDQKFEAPSFPITQCLVVPKQQFPFFKPETPQQQPQQRSYDEKDEKEVRSGGMRVKMKTIALLNTKM